MHTEIAWKIIGWFYDNLVPWLAVLMLLAAAIFIVVLGLVLTSECLYNRRAARLRKMREPEDL